MFIGENVNKKQIAALQLVEYACGGAQFARVNNLLSQVGDYRDCQAIEEIAEPELNELIDQLVKECLVERREIRGMPHVGLTDDGKRCNLISVDL